jgi:hypothetical protein
MLTFASTSVIANPTRGVASDSDLLRPEQVVTYRVMLEPNEVTRFFLRGDGDGDIDCILLDDNGNEIGRDTDSTDSCVIDVNPRWRATFTFRAVNNGSLSSLYSFRAY